MQLKSFTGASLAEAMQQIRAVFGDGAIIVATRPLPDGQLQVTAAVDDPIDDASDDSHGDPRARTGSPSDRGAGRRGGSDGTSISVASSGEGSDRASDGGDLADPGERRPPPHRGRSGPIARGNTMGEILSALRRRGAPEPLVEAVLHHAAAEDAADPHHVLRAALDREITFEPTILPDHAARVMLIGPTAGGRTKTLVKLAVRTLLQRRTAAIVTCDVHRSGATETLQAFTEGLGLTLFTAGSAEDLHDGLRALGDVSVVLIDTPACDGQDAAQVDAVRALLADTDIMPIAVLPAGLDAEESTDLARQYRSLDAERAILTRLDSVQRSSTTLAAVHQTGLSLTGLCDTVMIRDGYRDATAAVLARHILMPRLGDGSAGAGSTAESRTPTG